MKRLSKIQEKFLKSLKLAYQVIKGYVVDRVVGFRYASTSYTTRNSLFHVIDKLSFFWINDTLVLGLEIRFI